MAINFPNSPVNGNTYKFNEVTYIYSKNGGDEGYWKVALPQVSGVASIAEIDEGTNNIKYMTPYGIQNSKYLQGDNTLVTVDGGSVARDLSERFADFVNVKDFGAVGDGIVDDTIAIKSAVTTGKSVLFPRGTYWVTSNIAVQSGTYLYSEGCDLVVKNSWVDDTGNHYALQRAVIYAQNVEYVKVEGIKVSIDEISGGPNTHFMVRSSNNIHLLKCSGVHPVTRVSTINPFDLESTNNDIWIEKCHFQNETGAASGGCWVRNLSSSTVTSRVWITECTFTKDSGDEVLAVYGVLGGTKDIFIYNNTFSATGVKNTQGQLISIFPLANHANAAVANVHFRGNTVVAIDSFVNSVIGVGHSGETSNQCDNIFIEDNYILFSTDVVSATTQIFKYTKNAGANNVTTKNNIVEQVGTSEVVDSIFAGPWLQVEGNTVSVNSTYIINSCLAVSNNRFLNTASGGRVFYNVESFSNNHCTSQNGGQIFARAINSVISDNEFYLSGTSYFLSLNNVGTPRASTYELRGNKVVTSAVITTFLQLDSNVTENSTILNNTFTGVKPTEFHVGGSGLFHVVANNTWFDFTDAYSDVSPYRSYGYNRMIPLGTFVYNNNIGAATGTITLGWSKQEHINNGTAWKAVKATI